MIRWGELSLSFVNINTKVDIDPYPRHKISNFGLSYDQWWAQYL